MNKKKALKKLDKINSQLKNCRFEIIQTTLISFGFEEHQPRKGSSHFKFTKDSYIIIVPFKRPVKEIYVKRVITLLEEIINEEYSE